jgi:hypothetical protein
MARNINLWVDIVRSGRTYMKQFIEYLAGEMEPGSLESLIYLIAIFVFLTIYYLDSVANKIKNKIMNDIKEKNK